MKKFINCIKAWFSVFFGKKNKDLQEENLTVDYDWSHIVQAMKLYDIPEDKIVIGKTMWEVKYLDGKDVEKTLTIEYPITWDGENGKPIFHEDIEHNIRLGKKKLVDVHEEFTLAGMYCIDKMLFDLGGIMELNVDLNKKKNK